MTTCIFTANSSIHHDTGPGHPECPERIPSIISGLKKIPSQKLIFKNVGSFDEKYIKLAHSEIITVSCEDCDIALEKIYEMVK